MLLEASLIQVAGEPIELVFPEAAIAGDPRVGLPHRARDQLTPTDATVAPAHDQPGPLEDLEVFGDGRQGHAKRPGQGAHRGLAAGQPAEHRAPRGIGKGGEGGIERGLIFNHMV